MNKADRKVNTYACKNATNNSKQLRPVEPNRLITVATDHTKSLDDAVSTMMPRIANTLLGTKFKVVSGYADTDLALALERGEVEGLCGLAYSTLKATRPNWFTESKVNVLLQIGLSRAPDLPDVPSALELVSNAQDKKVLELILARQEMGRPFAAPPGVPLDRIALLRRAFGATLKDPEFLSDAKRLQMEIDPLTGEEIQTLLKAAYAAAPTIVAEAAKLVP